MLAIKTTSNANVVDAPDAERRLRILVTDDDPIQRAFANAYLEKTAGIVDTADCAEEGLRKLKANAYDCVLMDIDMPGMGGFEGLKSIRSDPALRRLPVIMVTSREDVASIDKAYKLGASSFTTKPVNWTLLSYHIRYVVREARGGSILSALPRAGSGNLNSRISGVSA